MPVPEFDVNAGLPDHKYKKIADHIALRIEAGELPPLARITEPDLAAEYGVNKLTIRNTLRVLRERGLIRTLAGTGSFILPQDESADLGHGDGDGPRDPEDDEK